MLVATLLTWNAYYSNSHPATTKISESVFLILFPPSVGLMATENASKPEQIMIVVLLVIGNGGLYWLISFLVRKLTGLAEEP
jgi:putative effector of murein hydrolase LrgA (UPF0299 family)